MPILISAFGTIWTIWPSWATLPWSRAVGTLSLQLALALPTLLLTHSGADRCLQSDDFANLALGVNNAFVKSFAP